MTPVICMLSAQPEHRTERACFILCSLHPAASRAPSPHSHLFSVVCCARRVAGHAVVGLWPCSPSQSRARFIHSLMRRHLGSQTSLILSHIELTFNIRVIASCILSVCGSIHVSCYCVACLYCYVMLSFLTPSLFFFSTREDRRLLTPVFFSYYPASSQREFPSLSALLSSSSILFFFFLSAPPSPVRLRIARGPFAEARARTLLVFCLSLGMDMLSYTCALRSEGGVLVRIYPLFRLWNVPCNSVRMC